MSSLCCCVICDFPLWRISKGSSRHVFPITSRVLMSFTLKGPSGRFLCGPGCLPLLWPAQETSWPRMILVSPSSGRRRRVTGANPWQTEDRSNNTWTSPGASEPDTRGTGGGKGDRGPVNTPVVDTGSQVRVPLGGTEGENQHATAENTNPSAHQYFWHEPGSVNLTRAHYVTRVDPSPVSSEPGARGGDHRAAKTQPVCSVTFLSTVLRPWHGENKKKNSGVQVYSAISSPLCVTACSQKKRRHLFTKKREIRNLHIKKMDQDRFRFGNRFSFYSVNRVLSLRLYTTGRLWVGPNETKRSVQRRGKQGGNSRSPGGGGGGLFTHFVLIHLKSVINYFNITSIII